MNLSCLDRMQSEATMASEFSTKLTAARSIPEVATVYQKWATRRMEMAAEDAKRLFADSQKLHRDGSAFAVRRLAAQWPRGRLRRKEEAMERYDFEVLKGDETISAARSVALPDPRAAWPRVAELARKVAEPGCQIRVTNEAREMVILIGVAAARHIATDVAA